jgi:hypothetical protein
MAMPEIALSEGQYTSIPPFHDQSVIVLLVLVGGLTVSERTIVVVVSAAVGRLLVMWSKDIKRYQVR